jgi:hypothetical protein
MIKRIAIQLLAEFIGGQKLRLIGVGVSRLREIDSIKRNRFEADADYLLLNTFQSVQ